MTTDPNPAPTPARRNMVLYIAVVLLACAVIAVGLLAFRPAWQERSQDPANLASSSDADVPAEVYAEVLRAATDLATAFVSVDHRKLDESIEAVTQGATGTFAEQYKASTDELKKTMTEHKSIMTGKVLGAGVVGISEFSARVLVSTTGTVQNTSTDGTERARELRLQLDLSKVDDKWLVSDLQFVG